MNDSLNNQPRVGELVDGEYPFQALLFSGKPLQTKKLGRFIIDLESLVYHKPMLTVDYNHDEERVMGYGGGFQVTKLGLVTEGRFISDDFVDGIVNKIRRKTPFEMSPTIQEEEGDEEVLKEGETTMVNGEEQSGPLRIFRNVPMRGYSVCPYGTDKFTSLTVLKKENEDMSKNKSRNGSAGMTKLAEDTSVSETPETTSAHPDLEEFIEIFGLEFGTELFRKGADIEEARKYKELKEKFDLPTPSDDATDLNLEEEEKKVVEETVVEKKEEDEKTGLKATLTALRKELREEREDRKKMREEMTRLKAVFPRGESASLSHGFDNPSKTEPEKPKSSIDKMAKKFSGK